MLRVLTVLDDPIAPICSKICGTAAAVRGPTNPTTIASHPTARVNCTVAPSGRDASHRGVAGVKLVFPAANTLWTSPADGYKNQNRILVLNDADGASYPAQNGERAEAGP